MLSPGGVRAEAGQADPARVTVLATARFVGEPDLILFNPQQERAELSVISSGRSGQRVISGTEPISLAPGEAKTIGYAEAFDGGIVVRADNGQPVVAALRLTGPLGDPASQSGVAAQSRSCSRRGPTRFVSSSGSAAKRTASQSPSTAVAVTAR